MCGNSSTTGNCNNSLYKFLKSLKESTTTPECPLIITFNSFKCQICHKRIIEARTKRCTHNSCRRCEPKYCSEKCRSTYIETITDCPLLQKKIAEGYKLCGMMFNGEILFK